ncbi:MAG: hypothetical protein Q4B58_05350 [Bacteroidales bacterium]|nr:hypothetical protein [Bacteroidales bacterium]
MKKYIKTIFTSICIAIFYLGLSGCSLFESDNDIRVEIVKACDENNFAEAYMLSDKLEDKREDIKYIVRRECIFNLEKNGENSLPKIVTIVSEQNASWVYNDLLKVAIVMGNEPLAKKLFNLYPECDQEIISSATNADFEELIVENKLADHA